MERRRGWLISEVVWVSGRGVAGGGSGGRSLLVVVVVVVVVVR